MLKSNSVNPAIGPFVQPIYGLRNEMNAAISAKDAVTITNSVVMCGGSNCRLGGSKTWNIQGDYIVSNCTATGAQQNPFNLEVLPKVSVEAPRTWKVLSYGSNFTSFDAKKWSVTGPDEFRRPRVSHDKGVAGLLALSGWLRSGETPLPRLEAVRLLR